MPTLRRQNNKNQVDWRKANPFLIAEITLVTTFLHQQRQFQKYSIYSERL